MAEENPREDVFDDILYHIYRTYWFPMPVEQVMEELSSRGLHIHFFEILHPESDDIEDTDEWSEALSEFEGELWGKLQKWHDIMVKDEERRKKAQAKFRKRKK